jgi:hypothetical protein
MVMVAEGVRTTHAGVALAARHHVELPIAGAVKSVLDGARDPRQAIRELMLRDPKDGAVMSRLRERMDTKLYYSISEASAIAKVKPHVLRYWKPSSRCSGPRRTRPATACTASGT